ncbi:drug resistance transporter, Bcr/CflA subfamily [Chelatococcus sambhunathii]|uniref:Bcr/CflA family efflux transporter n=1 Tax=Chelatococcus sambhunathii TaxID=363953 RepID=A0ABM9U4C2_9HYPH|nr:MULTISPECIES: multidrug effflux MFS transporter [Chelatococcus]CUA87845.1 drug resistance transporter, Bcr/CflA subfamily [Chelatococcus sambhunathii]
MNRPFPPQAVTAPPRPSLAVLVAVSALQPFALNVLAPATPALARTFATDYATIQLTLGLYLLAVAVTQVVIGPISDRFGRRPCVIGGVALFTIGSFAGAFAFDTVTLLAARVVQAAGGGTAFALARAIVRDTSERDEAASRIGYLTMVMVVAPMVAPFVGGVIDSHLGWRAIFGVKTLFGVAVLAYAFAVLGETAPKTHLTSVGDMLRAFPLLLGDRGFLGYALAMSFTSAAFFAFIAGAPFVVVESMGRSADVYGAFFALTALGYMVGNFVSGRYALRMGTDLMVTIGTVLSLAAIGAEVVLIAMMPWTPVTLFLPLVVNAVGNGLTMPGATAGALSARPEAAGTAAGVAGALQLGLGALVSFITGAAVVAAPTALIAVMAICIVASFAAHRYGRSGRSR